MPPSTTMPVAGRVHRHFASHLAAERERGTPALAALPDEAAIAAMVDAAFWASLRRHEGYPLKVTLAYLTPEQTRLPMRFGQRLALNADTLTRLAPAVERPGVHLGVWRDSDGGGDGFCVWGATRRIPALCFVLEVVAPGLLVFKHRRTQEARKFVNIAVLEGDRMKVVDPRIVTTLDSPAIVASLLGIETAVTQTDSTNVLIQLAVSMRAHGRGGAVLVVPDRSHGWRESIVAPISYAVQPEYTELVDLIAETPSEERWPRWQESLRRAVDVVAGLTAVDGAMVLTDRCALMGFGAKIGQRAGFARVERVVDTEPVEGAIARTVHANELGGTRHLSAAQFAHDQRDSLAMVASQDGRFTVFAWSAVAELVVACRVEALLL